MEEDWSAPVSPCGDGWFGHWTPAHRPAEDLERLDAALEAAGRDRTGFRIKASLMVGEPEGLAQTLTELSGLGVQEVVLIAPVRTGAFEADLEVWAAAAGLGRG